MVPRAGPAAGRPGDGFASREIVLEPALAEHIDTSSLPLRRAIKAGVWRLDTP
jgi:hypothetical protein